MNKQLSALRSASKLLALEPRLLFDGAAVTAVADEFTEWQMATVDDADDGQDVELDVVIFPEEQNVLAIIDASVADYDAIVAELPANITIRIVQPGQSGLDEIRQALQSSNAVFDTIHIISHGTEGSFTLGSDTLNNETLLQYQQQLQSWAEHLTLDADILLYGCDIAQGEQGQGFIDNLAVLTGADIAASTNATGSADKGGDWLLETVTGSIEATAFSIAGYAGLLADTAIKDNQTATRVVLEDTETAITGITITDSDNPAVMTLRIQTNGGTSTVVLSGAASFSLGTAGTMDFTITGSSADIQNTLNSLKYTPTENQNSQVASFEPKITLTATDVSNSGNVATKEIELQVSAVNDNPTLATKVSLALKEGESKAFSLAQLAASAEALDPDIATGQQQLSQLVVIIDSLPTNGTLTFNGGVVKVGMVIPASDIAKLSYQHNGTDVSNLDSDSINITIKDGGGGEVSGSLDINITAKNVAPVITGEPSLIEGQVKAVGPTINLGDTADNWSNSTVEITAVTTGNQGRLFFDADGDGKFSAGDIEITGSYTFTSAQATLLQTHLMFEHNGAEPNAPGAVIPSYTLKVTDSGGGEVGASNTTTTATITIDVIANNDDPILDVNAHANTGAQLVVTEGTVSDLKDLLKASDPDINPNNPGTIGSPNTTPSNQIVYTVELRPEQGELQLFLSGTMLGPNGDGWIVLGDGGRFTQADLDAGNVRYYQTTDVSSDTADLFKFTVRDSAFGYDTWTDPANPGANREGGVRDTLTGTIAVKEFHFLVDAHVDPHANGYTGEPRPATPAYGGDVTYNFNTSTPVPGNKADAANGSWHEDNLGSSSGYVITKDMLEYTIKLTDKNDPNQFYDIPADETVYTITEQPENGNLERLVGGVWVTLANYSVFTQQDIDDGKIRFVHDGGENHTASFKFNVSDGTENKIAGDFQIDVAAINDRPLASGGNAQVGEGAGNTVRLGAGQLGMSDADGSTDPIKADSGEGAEDFLWFKVTSVPTEGTLQYWNGSAWADIDGVAELWLPSTLLAATADGGVSGLRYVHNGTEPLAYAGGPFVSFDYVVRDDLANPNDPYATNNTVPVNNTNTPESNISTEAKVRIDIVPDNDGPQVAQNPDAVEPNISAKGTIAGGGATVGNNEVLNVSEGGTGNLKDKLVAVDPDNTTVQRQYRITDVPDEGTLFVSGKALSVGSTFTQQDLDNGLITYRHGGNEVGTLVDGKYHDKFSFIVSDGAKETPVSDFWITLTPTNDAPEVTVPVGPIKPSGGDGINYITGVTVADADLTDNVIAGEEDFIQVTVRVKDGVTVLTSDVKINITVPADSSGKWNVQGADTALLQLQGTRAQVNEALAALNVAFDNDVNKKYTLEVIADDRLRDASGTLTAGANGGLDNQAATAGGAPTAIDSNTYNWSSALVPTNSGNISAGTVEIWSSKTNEIPTLTVTNNVISVNEDIRSRIPGGDFVIADAESAAFDTPVTLTITVPNDHGKLHIGKTGSASSVTPSGVGTQAVAITGQSSGTLTLTGRAADIQALLNDGANSGGLYYTSPTDVNHDLNGVDAGDVSVSFSLVDGQSAIGQGTHAAVTGTIALDITAVNDAPVVGKGTGVVLLQPGAATLVPGFTVTDKDIRGDQAGNDPVTDLDINVGEKDFIQVTVRLQDNNGTWQPLANSGSYAGVTFGTNADMTVATGNGTFIVDATYAGTDNALIIRGSLDAVNAYLAGLTVQIGGALANTDTTYRVEIIADDRLRDFNSGALAVGADAGLANGGKNASGTDTVAVPSAPISPYTAIPAGLTKNVHNAYRDVFPTSVNDPATIEGSITAGVENANGRVTLTGLEIKDSDALSGDDLTVVIKLPDDFKIHAIGGSGGSIDSGGVGSNTVTITGTLAEINSRLNAIEINLPNLAGTPDATDWNGNFAVTVTVDDLGNNGERIGALPADTADTTYRFYDDALGSTDPRLITERQLTFEVKAVNDAPVVTGAPAGGVLLPAVDEDSTGTAVADAKTVAELFGSYFNDDKDQIDHVVNNGAEDGTDKDEFFGVAIVGLTDNSAQGSWQYYDSNSGEWTDIGTRNSSNALVLEKDTAVRFKPAANFHGTPNQLTVRLIETDINNDSASIDPAHAAVVNLSAAGAVGGSTIYSAASIVLKTSVTSVNDAPSLTGTINHSTAEDTSSSVLTAAQIAAGFTFNDATDNQTGIIGGGNDASTTASAIAIVGNSATAAQGAWYYTIDGGGTWLSVPIATDNSSAIVLDPTNANHQVYFKPADDYNGPAGGLSIRAADNTYTGGTGSSVDISGQIGDTAAWSNNTGSVAINVTPVNDAPVLSGTMLDSSTATLNEYANNLNKPGTPTINLVSGAVLADIDLTTTAALTDNSNNFGAASITVKLTSSYQSGDWLGLVDGYTLPAGVTIDATSNGDGKDLKISFDYDTTLAEVEAVLNNLVYWSASDDPTDGAADRTIAYSVVVNDGNNTQSVAVGDNAGSGGTKDSNVLTGSFKLIPVNDPPVATDNTNTISEKATLPVTGNVRSDGTADSDPDTPFAELKVTEIVGEEGTKPIAADSTSGSNGTVIEGKYGILTIGEDGSYSYALDNNNPDVQGLNGVTDTLVEEFTYTLSDGFLTDTATLNITITGVNDTVTVTVPNNTTAVTPDGNINDHVVFESGLGDGSNPDADDLKVDSNFTISALDGLDSSDAIVIAYTATDGTAASLTLTKAAVEALSTTNKTIATEYGDLVLNGYSKHADGTITVDYIYTLNNAPSIVGTDTSDSFTITAKDRDGDTNAQTLNIKIVDDAPAAVNDSNDVIEGDTLTVTAADGVLANDIAGADGWLMSGTDIAAVVGIKQGANVGTVGSAIVGAYGSLTINADGSYTYVTTANSISADVQDVFTYTVRDADGDETTATLTINVENIGLTATSTSGSVNESGFTGGSTAGTGHTITNATLGLPIEQTADATTGNATYGSFAVNADGTYNYTLTSTTTGDVTDSFTYISRDTLGNTVTNTVTITIVDDAPTAVADTNSITEDSTTPATGNVLTGAVGGDNADIQGADGATVTGIVFDGSINAVTGIIGDALDGAYGSLTLNSDGSYSYSVDNNNAAVQALAVSESLTETFTYTITDGDGDSSSTTLIITINGNNDAPETNGSLPAQVNVDSQSSIDVSTAGGFIDIDGDTLTYSAAGLPPGLSIDPNTGDITGTLDKRASQGGAANDGLYTVIVTANDGNGGTVDQTFTWSVTNPEPIANNDIRTTPEDTPVFGNVLNGVDGDVADTDPDGDPLTVTEVVINGTSYLVAANVSTVVNLTEGQFEIAADGSYSFSPTADWHGVVPTISYIIADGDGGTATADLDITVTPVVDIADDNASTHAGVPVDIAVLANDSFEGTPLVTGTSVPTHGTVVINPDGTLTYTPNAGYVGSDSFTYTVTSGGVTETATVSINVTNDPAAPQPDTATTPEDTPVSGNLLTNDVDANGDPLTVTEITVAGVVHSIVPGATINIDMPGYGSITVGSNGNYSFTPTPDWHGTVPTIGYTVSDGNYGGSGSSTLDLTVTPVVDIADDNASTHAGVPVDITVLANDNFEGTPVVTGTSVPTHGTVTINPDGTITYTPNAGYVGSDSFTYTVTSGGVTETATVNITVTNDPAAPQPDMATTPEDTPVSGNLLSNDVDANGDPLTVTEITVAGVVHSIVPGSTINIDMPGYGSITVGSDGNYSFTPTPDWHGTVPTIGYTVSDGNNGGSASSTLDLTVTPVVDIADDNATTHAGVPVVIEVLDNDSFEGTPVVTGTSVPTHGTVTINPDGTITYTPNAGYLGADSFTYTVTSGGVTETATVSINVTNDAVIPQPDMATTPEDTPVSGNLLSNDVDANGDPLTVTQITVAGVVHSIVPGASVTIDMLGFGSITVGSDGNYSFTPTPDWHGTVPTIGYTVSDGNNGGSANSTLDISVTPVVDIVDDSVSTDAGKPVDIAVLANDSFEGTPVITDTSVPTHGTAVINPDGTITYTPNAGYVGSDSFTYTVTSGGVTETATVNITVTNDPAAPQPDTATTPEDTPVSGNLLSNDIDANGDPLTVTQITVAGVVHSIVPGSSVTIDMPGFGSITVGSDGNYSFTPTPDWHGTVPTIGYTVSDDNNGGSANSTLDLTVTPVVDIADDNASTDAGKSVDIDVLANDSFEGTPVITDTSVPAHGTVVINPDGTLTYTPKAGYVGSDSFTYTVTSGGVTETATVTLTVESPTDDTVIVNPETPNIDTELDTATPLTPDSSIGIIGSPVRDDPSVFFDSVRTDEIRRLPLPFHPIVYVNRAVTDAHQEYERSSNARQFGVERVQARELSLSSQTLSLGQDPNVFIRFAVEKSQNYSNWLNSMVQGRLELLNLSADRLIGTPDVQQPDPEQLVPSLGRNTDVVADASDWEFDSDVSNEWLATAKDAGLAISFSEQLRNAHNQSLVGIKRY